MWETGRRMRNSKPCCGDGGSGGSADVPTGWNARSTRKRTCVTTGRMGGDGGGLSPVNTDAQTLERHPRPPLRPDGLRVLVYGSWDAMTRRNEPRILPRGTRSKTGSQYPSTAHQISAHVRAVSRHRRMNSLRRAGSLDGLWLPVPDGAVGHNGAVGAPPLDLAALELILV
jgi:hypothetical protein